MAGLLQQFDRSESIQRKAKTVRNYIKDPLPRNAELTLASYTIEHTKIVYNFTAFGKSYQSFADFGDISEETIRQIDPDTLHRVAVTIGLTLVPFHFLLTDFATIRVECADFLTDDAIQLFEKFFRLGLAEFRYRQGLDPTREIRLVTGHRGQQTPPKTIDTRDRILLLNGGGKDTAVMSEMAKATGLPVTWCSANQKRRHNSVADVSGIEESCFVGFSLDQNIARDGRYKWVHVPYATLYMSVSLLVAVSGAFRYVCIGNEYSANFGNVRFKDIDINHQYSKAFEHEVEFQRYIESCVVRGVTCFSLLRPFYDIKIAAMLSRMPQYLGTFVSCNRGAQWCGKCSKCAFTYLAMLPWLGQQQMLKTFGHDFMTNKESRRYVLDLIAGKIKPWECVGTQDECRLALNLALKRHAGLRFEESPTRAELAAACGMIDTAGAIELLIRQSHGPHAIPSELWQRIGPLADRLTNEALSTFQENSPHDQGLI